jgi:semaphorin 6
VLLREINEIDLLHADDGRILKALNTRAPETRDSVGQVIVSDVQVLKFGKELAK